MSVVNEETAVSNLMYGKTAEEWWAVWLTQSGVAGEFRERASAARARVRASREDADARNIYREAQRANELAQARADLVYVFFTMAKYDVNILKEFINEFIVQ